MGRWTQVSKGQTDPAEEEALRILDARLAMIGAKERERQARSNMWLAHHWPDHYHERCVKVGKRHVCRRCAALYPLGLLVAVLSFSGLPPWPTSIDPLPIWLLSIPATVAYCAEAIGLINYNAKVQVGTTLLAAVAFGHALSYEFDERWSPEFWGPICIFGGIWFVFTALGMQRKKLLS
jgi:hypothetical protein